MGSITWFGHAAFKIESGPASVLIDPFFAPAGELSWKDVGHVDMVLISHDHGDHVGDAITICRQTGAMLGCMVGTAQKMLEAGLPKEQMLNGIGYNIGGTVACKGISATMTQAFHSSDSGAPAGYIIRMPDMPVIYHAGDTGIFSSMELLGSMYRIELAMLPMGGIFTMDAYQAAHAARLIGCSRVIPMHWGTFPVLAQSTEEFKTELARICPECDCLDMRPGVARKI